MQATLSHYRVPEEIGKGGMGVVYRAHDEHLDRDVRDFESRFFNGRRQKRERELVRSYHSDDPRTVSAY